MNQTKDEIESGDSAQAARINQKYGFSVVIGEHHRKNVHHIAERMAAPEPFRLKAVSYYYFCSEEDLIAFCVEHKIKLDHILETSSPGQTEKRRTPPQYSIPSGLTEKQKRFCDIYLMCRNATRAYMDANPSIKNANSAGACASSLLKKPAVREYLADRGLSLEARKPARKATEVSGECNHTLEA